MFVRVNFRIRAANVRCVAADGSMVGVLPTRDAIKRAQEQGLDLVEISPNADPPVCRIMDFGKFKYEENLKRKEARKHQHAKPVKEMKFHPNVEEHDYQTKLTHIKDFLNTGHKVKVTLTFRGRERAHRDLGFEVVNRILREASDVGVIEQTPKAMGRSIYAMLAPRPAK